MIKKCVPFFLTLFMLRSGAEEVNFPFPSRLVFNSNFSGNHEVYLLQNNRLTRLTDHPACDEYAVPNHAGDRITFDSDRNGNFDIFELGLKTMQLKQITRDPRDERGSCWSRDDRFLYYSLFDRSRDWISMQIHLKSGRSGELFPEAGLPSLITLIQNRRGDAFFFTAKALLGWRVAKYDMRQSRFIKLAKTGTCRPKISADDGKVAYVSGEDDGLGDIWIMNQDGSGKRNLTPDRKEFYDYYPTFSPDGQWIAFSSSPKKEGKNGYDLYLLHIATGKVSLIFRSPGNDAYPFWFE